MVYKLYDLTYLKFDHHQISETFFSEPASRSLSEPEPHLLWRNINFHMDLSEYISPPKTPHQAYHTI